MPNFATCTYANVVVYVEGGEVWTVEFTCLAAEICEGTPPDPGAPDQPCEPTYGPGGLTYVCDEDEGNNLSWGYDIVAWALVPPHQVRVSPFPRWLVGTPGSLSLVREPQYATHGGSNGPGGAGGFWSNRAHIPADGTLPLDYDDPDPGDIRDYAIGVRWRMVYPGQSLFGGQTVPESCWTFGERDWNGGGGACGEIVQHTYETSSFGLPANGPRFDYDASGCERVGPWTLDAYQVQVPTHWVVEWADEYWRWEQVGWEWGDCQCAEEEPPGSVPHTSDGCSAPPGICIQPGEWYGKLGVPRYDWVHHFIGWYPIDLRDYGSPTWFETSYQVTTTGLGGNWCPGHLYADPTPGNTVRVPVIEVQSVIVDQCRLDGTCGGLTPH